MKIHRCRVCSNSVLVPIGSLGDIAISNFTEKPEKGNIYPLELVYCEECTLLQLAHNFPRRLIYEDQYWYKSELNNEIVRDLEEIVTQALSHVDYGRDDTWIDIGANDGTLLSFVPRGLAIGIDPNKKLYDKSERKQPRNTGWVTQYWEDVNLGKKAKVITAIACLYDLPDPNKFVANVKNHLHKDGILVCQLMTLQPMIENNDAGNICHEHLEYYSYKSLVHLFEQNGLEIFRVEENDMNGGSYRLFVQHSGNGSVIFEEKQYTVQDLKNFFRRLERTKGKMRKFLQDTQGVIYGYGASTKMNTILQYYKIAPRAIIDVNPDKIGKYTVNTNIPIISTIPEDAEYLWVFPYGFLDYFREKEKQYKGKWLTSIPSFSTI